MCSDTAYYNILLAVATFRILTRGAQEGKLIYGREVQVKLLAIYNIVAIELKEELYTQRYLFQLVNKHGQSIRDH